MSGEGDASAQLESQIWPYGKPSNSFDLPCALPAPLGYGGTWEGQFDTYQLSSGSRAIKLEITGAYQIPGGGLCGTVTFGSGPSVPVATDPTAPPPGIPYDPADPSRFLTATKDIVESFPYEFHGPSASLASTDAGAPDPQMPALDVSRLQFRITLRQVYKSWCNLQYSYPDRKIMLSDVTPLYHPMTNCVPPDTFSSGSQGLSCPGMLNGLTILHVSCDQAALCLINSCDCNASRLDPEDPNPIHGCTINDPGFGETRFDLTRNGDALSGNVALPEGVEALHLTRAP